ncbi:MAG: glycosyltransferase family 4 protein [Coriobacteriia bacterium]|nr:glycosyltransferase family 4 protein [Coriobacteriia bacterium]
MNQLIHSIAQALVARGHHVTVYALPNIHRRPVPLLDASGSGIGVIPVPAPLLVISRIPVLGPLALFWTLRRWPHAAMRRVRRGADDHGRPGVVIADFTSADAAMESDAAGGPPAVVLRWANWAAELASSGRVFGLLGRTLRRIEDRVLANARCIVVNGRDIEMDLAARGAVPPRVVYIPSAIDTGRFSAGYDVADLREAHALREYVVLFPSMLRDIKGFDHLLRAFALLPESLRSATTVVATGRGDVEVYRTLADELGIGSAVVFLGEAPAEDIPRWFHLADVAVFPYLFGAGTSVASVEALAAGLPLVAYRVQAFEHIVDDGSTGYLVEVGDIEGLSRAIGSLLADPALRERMSSAASAASAQYDIERITDSYEQLLRSLAGGDR